MVARSQLHGFPLPWFEREIKTVHITRAAGSRQPRRRHTTGHSRLRSDGDIMMIDGVPGLAKSRTAERGWLQVKVYNADMQRGGAYVVEMFKQALRRQGWND